MSQQRRYPQMMVGGSNIVGQFGDTTYTKIFVGGLAWETQRETMRHYFEQFGEILEAVVITDKNTGRSKGYGFVTFKHPDAASRACQDPSPVIDGRRANCNLASLGAHNRTSATRPSTLQLQHGMARPFRPSSGSIAPPTYQGSSPTYFHQPPQYTFPYSAAYGYSNYSQENMYPMNYYSLYGGQHFSPYYSAATASATAPPGSYHPNFYPYYGQYAQSNQAQGYGFQYPQMVQYPYLPQQYSATGILSLPTSATSTPTGVSGTLGVAGTGSSASQVAGNATEHNSST